MTEIINSIEDIGKSLSSVKSNVTDENELLRNETNAKMFDDFSKTPSNINDTRKEFGTMNITTPLIKDDGKLTNESILRTVINNGTTSFPAVAEEVAQLNSQNFSNNGSNPGVDVRMNKTSSVYTNENEEANNSDSVKTGPSMSENSTLPVQSAKNNSTMLTENPYSIHFDKYSDSTSMNSDSINYHKNEYENFPQSVDLLKPQNQDISMNVPNTKSVTNNSRVDQPFNNYQASPTPYVISTGGSFLENQPSQNINTSTNIINSTSAKLATTMNNVRANSQDQSSRPQTNSSFSNQTAKLGDSPNTNVPQSSDVTTGNHLVVQSLANPNNDDMMAMQNPSQEYLNVPLIPSALVNSNIKENESNAQKADSTFIDNQGRQITDSLRTKSSNVTTNSPTQELMIPSASNITNQVANQNLNNPVQNVNNTLSIKNSEYPMNPTAVLSPEKKNNDSSSNIGDIMKLPASFNSLYPNNASIQLQRKNIIPTPSPHDRLAREYIPMYAPTVYSEDVNDFLDESVVPRQLGPDSKVSKTNGLGQSDVASLTSFLANERMEEQTIANEAQSVTRIHPHRVTEEKKEQETPSQRDKQG